MIALRVAYHYGSGNDYETIAHLIVARRENANDTVRLLEDLDRPDKTPRLHVVGGSARPVISCKWDDIVLDHKVRSLLKDDFESFFERQAWFHENNLPFRRGYLLHGPPGNGKSTAVRAMLSSKALTAYPMRFFDADSGDSDLDHLFELAVENRPSMVLLEDLDRAFPKTGETKSKISLQQLLNNLDGVNSGEGIVVVATANEPEILDKAILRRPGRFDRVVHFPNPYVALRQQYLQQLNPKLPSRHLKLCVEQSDGLSFAQLREVHIIAGQRAFERKGEIGEGDLLLAVRALRQSNLTASRNGTAAGFLAHEEVFA